MRVIASVLIGTVAMATVVSDADARHRYRHRDRSFTGLATNDAAFRRAARDYARARSGLGALVPRRWQMAPRDPDVPGSRFVSRTGDAWLHFYAVAANPDDVNEYWKNVAFREGEDLRLLRRDRAWVEVSGFKLGRSYFRKAVLACGEREWRHVEYEQPAEEGRVFQAQVDRISRAFDAAYRPFCDQTVGRTN